MAESVFVSEGRLATDDGPFDLSEQGYLALEHDWDLHGWAPFTAVTITADEDQVFTQSVVGGQGVLTSVEDELGGLRIAYCRDGTSWRDSEITSVIYGPGGVDWAANNAQQGHLHRVREVSPGLWEGIAAWTAVFGGDYGTINTRAVRWNGTTLWQSEGDAATTADRPFIDRRLSIVNKERTTGFGLYFNNTGVHPKHLYGLVSGDFVTVDSTDATFDQTAIALNGVNPDEGVVQVIEPTTESTSALAVDKGHVTPSGVSSQKRWCPFMMSTRVVGGTSSAAVVELKRWRPGEPTPGWDDPRVVRQDVVPGGSVPTVATEPGLCALWGAHLYGGSTASFGQLAFKRL